MQALVNSGTVMTTFVGHDHGELLKLENYKHYKKLNYFIMQEMLGVVLTKVSKFVIIDTLDMEGIDEFT